MNRIGANIGLRGDGGGIPLGIKSEFFFCMFGWLGLEPGFGYMVHTLNHLRGMGFSSRDQFMVPLWFIFVWDGLSLT